MNNLLVLVLVLVHAWCLPRLSYTRKHQQQQDHNDDQSSRCHEIHQIGNQLGRRPNITNYESCTRTLLIHLQSSSSFFTPSNNGQKKEKKKEQLIYKPGSWVQQLD
jgi:Na+-transporting NADH:ubiquinone oxidoreductase subunit NqrC